jgi:hypothetical protein
MRVTPSPPARCRRSPEISDLLPLLYLRDLSRRDFVPAVEQFLGSSAGVSASTITRSDPNHRLGASTAPKFTIVSRLRMFDKCGHHPTHRRSGGP